MAEQVNMQYTHMTLDCGAAIKAYHILFNNHDRFKHIILHLGDFHTMQAFFGVIGSYISGSGFEDIIFQLGLCQPGIMNALIKGKHYNQAWLIHESFAEALSRIFIEKYVEQSPVENLNSSGSNTNGLLACLANDRFLESYVAVKSSTLKSRYGKTVQFWMRYVSLVDTLREFHLALQSNKFDEKLRCWRNMLPVFFFFDRTHYSRYGSYYVKSMENLETTHPGAKDELEKIGISVRRNNLGIGQAADLAGEQGYMRDAKTAGGTTPFQTSKATVLKWVRSRPFQAKFTEALRDMANLDRTADNQKKCLRPSEIIKSNEIVLRIVHYMEQQFSSPFDECFEHDKLCYLVSDTAVTAEIAESLLSIAPYRTAYARVLDGGNFTNSM